MQKLTEVSDRKKNDACIRKRELWQEAEAHSLSGSDRRSDNTLLPGGWRHTYVFGWSVG